MAYFDLSKAFGTVSQTSSLLMKYGLDEQTVRWTESYLNGWA